MRYVRVSLDEALKLRKDFEQYLDAVQSSIEKGDFNNAKPLEQNFSPSGNFENAILWEREPEGNKPHVRYRQGGDDFITIEYGNEEFDINHRCRVTALEKEIRGSNAPSWLKQHLNNTVGCCTSLMLYYDGSKVDRQQLIKYLQSVEDDLGDLTKIKVVSGYSSTHSWLRVYTNE
jgi:hypothetical protein